MEQLERIYENNKGSLLKNSCLYYRPFAIAITVLMLVADVSFVLL